MITVLVVEDDKNTRMLTETKLKKHYNIVSACDGEEALDIIYNQSIDLVLADLMMPKMDGYTLIKELREVGNSIPVLLLTARQEMEDKRKGFEYGADDYMTKPINYEELVLRINALLRRTNISNKNQITMGKAVIDSDDYSFKYDGEFIELPKKEFELLFKLISYPNKTFTKAQLLEEIWGYDTYSLEDTVKTHINKLRSKLKCIEEFEILNMKGIGYKLIIKEGKNNE